MNDSRDFQDAESARSGHSHVTSQPVSFPPHPVPGGMLSRSIGMPSCKDCPPSIWDTHGISGNVFASPTASSSAPFLVESNPWISNCADFFPPLFLMMIFRNSIRNGTEFFVSMTKIPHDDILEGLYKLRIRGSEKLKTVLELYNMEIHQEKTERHYHRLKTMVKRSIEQDLRIKNFEARNGNYERNAVVKNQGTKQRGQRILGDCQQLEANGQCSEGDNCSFRHDMNKCAKMTQPNPSPNSFMQQDERKHREAEVPEARVPVVECLDGPARITSKELAPIHSVKSGTSQNACSTRPRVVTDLGKSALMQIARLMSSPAKGPKRMMTKVQWPC